MVWRREWRVTFRTLFFRTGHYESDVLFRCFFWRSSKSLRLIKKIIEPYQYKNLSLPQYCVSVSISCSRVGSQEPLIRVEEMNQRGS